MKYCSSCGSSDIEFKIPEGDNRKRYCCNNCGTIFYTNPNTVVGALCLRNEKILMAKRNIDPRKGLWTLPAGFMENAETLQDGALRETFEDTYLAWQYIEMFDLGMAEMIEYHLRTNTYPTGVSNVENNIMNEMYDLSTEDAISYKSQGLPAIDYMLHGLDNDQSMVINYYTGNDGPKYMAYLNVLVDEMISNTDSVKDYWSSNRNSFVNSNFMVVFFQAGL